MNYLAHLALSGEDQQLMIGNYIADGVRSSQLVNFEPRVRAGIRLHWLIDQYTDNHPVVFESKQRLRSRFHKYAPVIVDLYYDHFLAANWVHYSKTPLQQFAQEAYALLGDELETMPIRAQHFYHYMVHNNVLVAYASLDGIHKVFKGMAGRANFNSGMEHATEFLKQHYDSFQQEFALFYPELQQQVLDAVNSGRIDS